MHAAFHEYLASTAVGGLALAYGLSLFTVGQTRGDRAMAFAWVFSAGAAIDLPHVAGQVEPGHVRIADLLLPVLVAGVSLGVWGTCCT